MGSRDFSNLSESLRYSPSGIEKYRLEEPVIPKSLSSRSSTEGIKYGAEKCHSLEINAESKENQFGGALI